MTLTIQQKMEILQENEINFSLTCFFDSGWEWKLGDRTNGWKAQGEARSLVDAVQALWKEANGLYTINIFGITFYGNKG